MHNFDKHRQQSWQCGASAMPTQNTLNAQTILDLTTAVTTTTCDDNTGANVVADATIHFENMFCPNITFVEQAGTTVCASRFQKAAEVAAQNIEDASNRFAPEALSSGGSIPHWLASILDAFKDMFTIKISDTTALTSDTLTQILKEACGTNNIVKQIASNLSVSFTGVECSKAELFVQNSNANITCLTALSQGALNAAGISGKPSKGGASYIGGVSWASLAGYIAGGVVLLILIVFVAVMLLRKHNHGPAAGDVRPPSASPPSA